MPKAPKARTRHSFLTTEAFREIVENALEELVENNGTLEIKDLRTWSADLTRQVGRVSDRADADTIDRNPLSAGAE